MGKLSHIKSHESGEGGGVAVVVYLLWMVAQVLFQIVPSPPFSIYNMYFCMYACWNDEVLVVVCWLLLDKDEDQGKKKEERGMLLILEVQTIVFPMNEQCNE